MPPVGLFCCGVIHDALSLVDGAQAAPVSRRAVPRPKKTRSLFRMVFTFRVRGCPDILTPN
jgi:hypothetical protein